MEHLRKSNFKLGTKFKLVKLAIIEDNGEISKTVACLTLI